MASILRRRFLSNLAAIIGSSALVLLLNDGAAADVITSSGGGFEVGIDQLGNLYDPVADVGFRRVSDGYDPIQPGTPREAYGVAAGSNSGYVDSNNSFLDVFGIPRVSNIVANGSPSFGANSAMISTFLQDGSGSNLLQIDQFYSFTAENVLKIATTITNVSGAVQDVQFSRNVDWDVAPSQFYEQITVDPLSGPVVDSSYYGFENPDPLIPFGSSAGASGGIFGPDDLGGGLLVDFGAVADGGSVSFNIFHAINLLGQTEAGLRAQLGGFGGHFDGNAALLGFGLAGSDTPSFIISGVAVPEPSSIALVGLGLIGLPLAHRARRRVRG